MNPATLAEALSIATLAKGAARSDKVEVAICPSFVHIQAISTKIGDGVILGCQDLSAESAGSHMGEVSAAMLKDLGVSLAIIGHSERRKKGETSATVSKKTLQALEFGITPVVCVGEESRDPEGGSHFEFIKNQLKESLEGLAKNSLSQLIIAYEPVWAIGAAAAMNPADVHETAIFIRKTLTDLFGQSYIRKTRVIYGGAVDATNAHDLIEQGQVDGFLVGRASLNDSFGKIVNAAE